MAEETYKALLQECRRRRNEDTAQKFIRLIEQLKDYYTDQLVFSDNEGLHTRKGQALALRHLYEDLTDEPKHKPK